MFPCAQPCGAAARQIRAGNALKHSFEIGGMNWMLELCETQTSDENCNKCEYVQVFESILLSV